MAKTGVKTKNKLNGDRPDATEDRKNLPEKQEKQTLESWLTSDKVEDAIRRAAPRHLSAETFLRMAITTITRRPKLRECSLASIWECLIDLSALGLTPDNRRAHLIPYGKTCTLIIDYKGLVELVRRSGEVSYIHCDVVYEKDEFTFEYGSAATLRHVPALKDRGDRKCVYSFVRLKDGAEDFKVYDMDHIEGIRKRSKASNDGPWKTDFDEMAKKTCFRNHSKWLPLSVEVHHAIEADDRYLFPDIGHDTITGSDIRDMADGSRMKIKRTEPVDAETEPVEQAPEPEPEAPVEEKTHDQKCREIQAWPKSRLKAVCEKLGIDSKDPALYMDGEAVEKVYAEGGEG